MIELTADDFIAAFRAFDAAVQIASAEERYSSMCGRQIPILRLRPVITINSGRQERMEHGGNGRKSPFTGLPF